LPDNVKILYISQYFPPEPGAPAARVYELSRAWVRSGAEVSVLTGFPNHPTGVLSPEYRGKIYTVEAVDGIRVHRAYIYAAANRGFWGRCLNYVSFAVSAVLVALTKLDVPDLVVATSPQFLVAVAGYVVARALGVPFVFEVRDLWPDSIVAVGAMSGRSAGVRLLKGLELFLYRHADHIVVVTDTFKRILGGKGIPLWKISVVKNGVDLCAFHPGPKPHDLLSRHGLEGKFVLAYIGTIGMAHGVGVLIEAARRMRLEPDVRFVVIGEGAERAALAGRARAEGLRNIVFLGSVPRPQVRDWILASDACAVVLKDRALFRSVIPSKIFEILACARPIILGVAGEAAGMLEQARAGIVIPPEDVDRLCAAVRALRADAGAAAAMGRRGRRFVEGSFDRDVQAAAYLALLADARSATAIPDSAAARTCPDRMIAGPDRLTQ
jgi:colanic acid biosynthesis glycosyl transferase WcaI